MPSIIATLLKAQITLLNPLINAMELETQRKLQDGLALLGAKVAGSKIRSRNVRLPFCQACWTAPRKGVQNKAILYLHGGAYTAGTLDYAKGFGGLLALETGRVCLCVGYRLAPEHPFPAALEDAMDAYRLMLERYQPEDIAFAGESAGGGLLFCLALKCREEGLPLPESLVALSPWVDLAQSLDACALMGKDPVLSREGLQRSAAHYLAGHDAKDPLVSPLYGDLSSLPRTLIITGGDEILLAESREFAQKLRQAGTAVHLHVEEGMWHVYPLYPVPEARQAQAMMLDFLDKTL